jgi:fatty-acyl-CoA synthase
VIGHAFRVARSFGIDAGSTVLLAPPLCGVFGFCNAMAALVAGRPLVMRPVWDADRAAHDIVRHGVTHANATDEAIAQLLAARTALRPFPDVRFFGYAAFNPALGDIVARADARGLKLVGLYGFSAPESRMAGYYGDPQATAQALTEDGFYRSGDLGCTHADGRFTFLARMGDSLRLGGFLVSPLEIESLIQEQPGIAACQVIGVPREGGLRPVAFVILEPGAALDERALLARLSGKLARYKLPIRVFQIAAFPVTPGANATKIQKGKLRQMAESLLRA